MSKIINYCIFILYVVFSTWVLAKYAVWLETISVMVYFYAPVVVAMMAAVILKFSYFLEILRNSNNVSVDRIKMRFGIILFILCSLVATLSGASMDIPKLVSIELGKFPIYFETICSFSSVLLVIESFKI